MQAALIVRVRFAGSSQVPLTFGTRQFVSSKRDLWSYSHGGKGRTDYCLRSPLGAPLVGRGALQWVRDGRSVCRLLPGRRLLIVELAVLCRLLEENIRSNIWDKRKLTANCLCTRFGGHLSNVGWHNYSHSIETEMAAV